MEQDTVAGSDFQGPAQSSVAPPPEQSVHRSVMRVDQSGGITARRHILLPVDDSDDSEAAIIWAIKHIFREGDVFHLLHVIPEPQMVHIWGGMYVPPEDDAELMEVEETKDFVRHRFAKALLDSKVPFRLHVVVGPVDSEAIARVIAQQVDKLDVEAVVMARHSKGKLKELWLGSVTKLTVDRADCPVVVVPHP